MLSKEKFRQIELLKISTKRIVDNLFAGDYFSIYKGRGTEFLEIREYFPGYDDIREIDWNVTARAGTAHVKKFREERDIIVILLVDISSSMGYGSKDEAKRDKALELAALIGMSVIKRNNRLGLIAFTDRVEVFLKPCGGRKQFYRLMDSLINIKTEGRGTDVSKALKFLNRTAGKGTVVFLISDFISDDYSRVLKTSSRRYDLIPVVIEDQLEIELPEAGLVELIDSESGETALIDSSYHPFIRQYTAAANARKKKLYDLFRSAAIDSITITTNRPVLSPVKELFYRRVRMRSMQ
ncbi:MAG: DUF58 domain-containing protein [Nitrospinae bacterium]|nr:DUF58 domain-containing protein [Nitrospinota bacterium]MBI3814993.1 DUF58 domain-containing protein [Nitrospinota bacterium]